MSITMSTPTAQIVFPAGTTDTPWSFVVAGTNPDGSSYGPTTVTASSPSAPAPSDLQVGAIVTLVVTKNGISSLASAPFTVPSGPVTLTVPDAGQPATFTVA